MAHRFRLGDRLLLLRPRTVASFADLVRVWTVTECGCELCGAGGVVPVDEWLPEVGWRHFAQKSLRLYGRPQADELVAPKAPERTPVGYQRKKTLVNDRRKQSLYFPVDMLAAIDTEAKRLDRSLSWVVQRCIKIAMQQIRDLPTIAEPEYEAAE
jgi:uncharacterized small protein (TIGR04563 family)